VAFRDPVEFWRPYADAFNGDVPTDFTLDWIDKESGGNRCNFTSSAGFPEVGILQLDPGNMAMAGTDQETLRAGCTGQFDASGTPDDLNRAMSTGIDYIKALKNLTHGKVDWPENSTDFWSLVRLQHAAGIGATDQSLAIAKNNLGRAPANWDEFIANGCCPPGRFSHWADVAAENGSWAAGFQPSVLATFSSPKWLTWLGLAATLLGAWWFERRSHRLASSAKMR
jgi:hypothetical protein